MGFGEPGGAWVSHPLLPEVAKMEQATAGGAQNKCHRFLNRHGPPKPVAHIPHARGLIEQLFPYLEEVEA
jgi:hypothetical protein